MNFCWLCCLLALFFLVILTIAYALLLGIGPYPTSKKIQQRLLSLVSPAYSGVLYELGAGWGGLAYALARRCPRAHIVALERSPFPYFFCRVRRLLFRQPNLTFYREDFRKRAFEQRAILVAFLCRSLMQDLSKQLSTKELAFEGMVLSHTFSLPQHQPLRKEFCENWSRTPIYLYQITEALIEGVE